MKALTPYLLSICFFINIGISYSQKTECATVTPEHFRLEKENNPVAFEELRQEIEDNRSRKQSGGSCINYQPILPHIIRRSNGTGGISLSSLNAELASMNATYAPACVAFYFPEVRYINSDTYYDFNTSQETALRNAYEVDSIINIFFANSVTTSGGSSVCGYAYYPGNQDVILMRNSCATNGSTLTHEVGHFFNLPHTHNGGTELVNGSNCGTAGDRFCDTPADPNISGQVNSSCVYTGNSTDANGDTYVPDPRNVMSYSRKACRTFFSNEQLAEVRFNFENVRNYFYSSIFDIDFSANVLATCADSLTVQFTEMAVGESTYEWDFDNDGVIDATSANPTYTFTQAGTYDVRLVVSDGSQSISKVKPSYITIGSDDLPSTADAENFPLGGGTSSFINGWKSAQAGTGQSYSWRVDENGTPSNDTGPLVDHTLGTSVGNYFYTEASSPASTGDVAELISPCIDIPSSALFPELSFYYHMCGSNIDVLHVDIDTGSGWTNSIASINGQQQTNQNDPWLKFTLDLDPYKANVVQIRFRAIRGGGWRGDIAIDDIKLSEEPPCEYVLNEGDSGEGSLRTAVDCAQASTNSVLFNTGLDTIFINSTLVIDSNLDIQANQSENVIIVSTGNFPIFDIKAGVLLDLQNLTLVTPYGQSAFLFEASNSSVTIDGDLRVKHE